MDDDFLDRIDELVAKAATGKHAPRKHGSQEESPASRRKSKGGKERHSPQSTSGEKGPTKRQKAASRSSNDSDDDFQPAAKVPPPPVFTRTLKLGSKTAVTVKEVTNKIGAHRMLKALDGRKAIVWNLLMWDRSDAEENVEEKENPSEHGELPGEGAGLSPPKLKISDPADKIRGLAVAAEVGTVWYLPFDEDQAVRNAKLILTSGSQRKASFCSAAPLAAMVRAGMAPSEPTWDIGIALWATGGAGRKITSSGKGRDQMLTEAMALVLPDLRVGNRCHNALPDEVGVCCLRCAQAIELDREILEPRGAKKLGCLDGETIAALERVEMPLCLALAHFQAGGLKIDRWKFRELANHIKGRNKQLQDSLKLRESTGMGGGGQEEEEMRLEQSRLSADLNRFVRSVWTMSKERKYNDGKDDKRLAHHLHVSPKQFNSMSGSVSMGPLSGIPARREIPKEGGMQASPRSVGQLVDDGGVFDVPCMGAVFDRDARSIMDGWCIIVEGPRRKGEGGSQPADGDGDDLGHDQHRGVEEGGRGEGEGGSLIVGVRMTSGMGGVGESTQQQGDGGDDDVKWVSAHRVHLAVQEKIVIDFRSIFVSEQRSDLVICRVPNLRLWAACLLTADSALAAILRETHRDESSTYPRVAAAWQAAARESYGRDAQGIARAVLETLLRGGSEVDLSKRLDICPNSAGTLIRTMAEAFPRMCRAIADARGRPQSTGVRALGGRLVRDYGGEAGKGGGKGGGEGGKGGGHTGARAMIDSSCVDILKALYKISWEELCKIDAASAGRGWEGLNKVMSFTSDGVVMQVELGHINSLVRAVGDRALRLCSVLGRESSSGDAHLGPEGVPVLFMRGVSIDNMLPIYV